MSGNRIRRREYRVRCLLVLLWLQAATSVRAEDEDEDEISSRDGRWQLLPVILPAYQPETSLLLGGAAVLALQYPPQAERRESQITLAGAISIRKQYSVLLQPDLYLLDELLHIDAKLSAARFPDLYFGVGNSTRAQDREAFTPLYYELVVNPKLRLFDGAYLGPSVRALSAALVDIEANAALAQGRVTGSHGGLSVELGLAALWDSRDRTLYPRDGTLLRARFGSARSLWGSDFDYDLLRCDLRRYVSLPWHGHVLALQALVELRRGTTPFYDMSRLGGAEIMRGYYEGRFRDRQYLAVQAEHRFPLFWRLGGVVFVATGIVASTLSALRPAGLKFGVGGGLRLAPLTDVPINVRLDLAYGNELDFYFGIGEAF